MIAGLILAGGGGTRLGGADKAFLQLAGLPLINHLLARLLPQVDLIAISANGDPARFVAYPYDVLADDSLIGKGPLAGVAAGLAWAQAAGVGALLTVPVDTPFIPADLAAALGPAPAAAMYQGRQHHLVALWPVAFLPALTAFLAAPGAYKVRDALSLCAARQVTFTATADPFLNINTAADLAAAEARLSPHGPLC